MPETIDQMGPNKIDARIWVILHDEVDAMFWDQLPEIFGSIKTAMVEYFDDRYVVLTKAATVSVTSSIMPTGVGSR